MDTVYKYALKPITTLELPADAHPLTVQIQHGAPYLWVRLDPAAPTIRRTFVSFGTGHTFEASRALTYVATVQFEGMVFHVFEENSKKA